MVPLLLIYSSVLRKFTWKIPSREKIYIFSNLKAIISLFVDVVNLDINTKNEEDIPTLNIPTTLKAKKQDTFNVSSAGQYFMEILKRDSKRTIELCHSKDAKSIKTSQC